MKRELINSTYKVISDVCEQFVTLRNFDDIPDNCTSNNDIDILISKPDMPALIAAVKPLGYSKIWTDNVTYLYGAEPHTHFHNVSKDVHFDIVTGLYYRSLADDNIFVNVDEELLKSMFHNKIASDECWMYRPSPEDYLTHICCHVIFDKKQCNDKYASIIHNEFKVCDREKVLKLFNYAFYSLANNLVECIETNQAKRLFDIYLTSCKY